MLGTYSLMELLVMVRGSEMVTCSRPFTGVTFRADGGPMTAAGGNYG